MDAIAANPAAQWGAIAVLMGGAGWLIRWLVARLAAADARDAKRTDELLTAYRENTAAWSTVAEVLRSYKEARE